MKLVFDLQALQSPDSRNRGIGRYSRSLAEEMIAQAQARGHDVHGVLNHAFPDTLDAIKADFSALLPPEAFHVYEIPAPVYEGDPANVWRAKAAEAIREDFLQSLRPDLVHVSSLFEGFSHDCACSCPDLAPYPTAMTLYDIIPYLKQDHYLVDPRLRQWYMRKIDHLRRADLLLAISDYSRDEAIAALQLPPEKVVSISADADAHFTAGIVPTETEAAIRARYGLSRPFIMYTGGIDYRKNIEGLIEAYAALPVETRRAFQLAIVCNARPEDKYRLLRLAHRCGADEGDVVLTGFVTDDELVALYRLCRLFVFPSLHEGFGLPVLEAMRCGAPVIGANLTSIPEIIDMPEALFDPASPVDFQAKLVAGLTDEDFRRRLRSHGEKQARNYSWRESGRRALDAFEAAHERRQGVTRMSAKTLATGKPRLAFVSPLPPDRSGIADYSADLLPALSRHYQIDVVSDLPQITALWVAENLHQISTQQFDQEAHRYDRILYQIGNSDFHTHMFALLARHPGTVVLHDFFLSGLFNYLEATGAWPEVFQKNLYRSHGYPALCLYGRQGAEAALWAYPCNAETLKRAQGIIVHSAHSLRLAHDFYGAPMPERWTQIPLLRTIPVIGDKATARTQLQLPADAFVICSFGMLDQTKLNHQLLEAWLGSSLAKRADCVLVFVGDCPNADYRKKLQDLLKSAGDSAARVSITGFADEATYRLYLTAADLGVQLRSRSRGETSAAMADCLVYGLPLLVNANGAAAEIPADIAEKLPDEFTMPALKAALERLFADAALRGALRERSLAYTRATIAPEPIAQRYHDAIESFAATHPVARRRVLLDQLTSIAAEAKASDADLAAIARCVAENESEPLMAQHLLDITDIADQSPPSFRARMEQEIAATPPCVRLEPIFWDGAHYRYARSYALAALGLANPGLEDSVVEIHSGDSYRALGAAPEKDGPQEVWLRHHVQRGLRMAKA